MGNQVLAQHLARGLLSVVESACQFYAATLAAPACVYLGFNYYGKAEPLSRGARLLGSVSDFAARYRDAILWKKLFGLIFVDLHRSFKLLAGPHREERQASRNLVDGEGISKAKIHRQTARNIEIMWRGSAPRVQ